MDFNEYAEKFCNIKIFQDIDYDELLKVKNRMLEHFLTILQEKYNNGELSFSDNIAGHEFQISLQSIIDKEADELNLHQISDMIFLDIMRQSEVCDRYLGYMSIGGQKNNFDMDKIKKINIDDVFNGNINWKPGTVFNPEMSCFECFNDGKKYILTMNDWKIVFVDKQDFIRKYELSYMEPFEYSNSAVETKIDFKTNEAVVFNFLPREISDFIESHFSNSTHKYKGRDWQKNLNEIHACFGIYRTSSYCGGKVFQDDNCVILGKFNYENKKDSLPQIGETISTVWQTLIAEKENMIKLIMLALDKNKDEAEDYFKTNLIEEQNAVIVNVEPGKYYSYTVPSMSSDTDKNIFTDVKIKGSQSIFIDMLISKNKIKTLNNLDTILVVPENEIEAAKKVFNDFEANTVSLKI